MSFIPGDEVVCVEAGTLVPHGMPGVRYTAHMYLEKGKHYVVRWAGDFLFCNGVVAAVRVEGVMREDDTPFFAYRFRPVRRDSIDKLKQFAETIGKKNSVRAGDMPPVTLRLKSEAVATFPDADCGLATSSKGNR